MPTTNYEWDYIVDGDTQYPVSHSALVDAIDAELSRVEAVVDSKPDTDTDTTDHAQLTNVRPDQHHTKTPEYTDSDAVAAVNGDADHGSTAAHDYTTDTHTDYDWVRDGNAPDSTTGVSSYTYTLAGEYDLLEIHADLDAAGDGGFVHLQLDGVTATNYNHTDRTGATTNGDTSIKNIRYITGASRSFMLRLTSRSANQYTVAPFGTDHSSTAMQAGVVVGVSGACSQFTLIKGDGATMNVNQIDVFGRNIGE